MTTWMTRAIRATVACSVMIGGGLIADPSAADIVDNDRLLIDGDHADFGQNHTPHVWGSPQEAAWIDWGDNTDGDQWLEVHGRITLDAFWGGGCARVTIEARDGQRRGVSSVGSTVCGFGYTTAPYGFATLRTSDTSVRSVRICTTFNNAERRCGTRYRNA